MHIIKLLYKKNPSSGIVSRGGGRGVLPCYTYGDFTNPGLVLNTKLSSVGFFNLHVALMWIFHGFLSKAGHIQSPCDCTWGFFLHIPRGSTGLYIIIKKITALTMLLKPPSSDEMRSHSTSNDSSSNLVSDFQIHENEPFFTLNMNFHRKKSFLSLLIYSLVFNFSNRVSKQKKYPLPVWFNSLYTWDP